MSFRIYLWKIEGVQETTGQVKLDERTRANQIIEEEKEDSLVKKKKKKVLQRKPLSLDTIDLGINHETFFLG